MKTLNVVAAIIEKDNKIFATQRGYGEFKGGWEFPGGKVEPGESHEAALKREIEEELNTDISVDKFVYTVEYDYPNFHLTMNCYLSHVIEGDLDLLEHLDACWVDSTNIDNLDWLPADIDLVNEIKKQNII